jgi:hypothetical protein
MRFGWGAQAVAPCIQAALPRRRRPEVCGSDFNIAWEPTVILFTPQGVTDRAVNEHVLTDAQIDALLSTRDAIEVQLPTRTFICASVPASLYEMAAPAS